GVGNDEINVGLGTNLLFGDSAAVTWLADGNLSSATSLPSIADGNDTVTTGTGDNLVILGGGSDTFNSGNGFNVVVGDSGFVPAAPVEGVHFHNLPITLGAVGSMNDAVGGIDTIKTLNGNDIVIGGAMGDTIILGTGFNIVLGDAGEADFRVSG